MGPFWLHFGSNFAYFFHTLFNVVLLMRFGVFFDNFGSILAPFWDDFGTSERPETHSESKQRFSKKPFKTLGISIKIEWWREENDTILAPGGDFFDVRK